MFKRMLGVPYGLLLRKCCLLSALQALLRYFLECVDVAWAVDLSHETGGDYLNWIGGAVHFSGKDSRLSV